jgi:hypothetical protein
MYLLRGFGRDLELALRTVTVKDDGLNTRVWSMGSSESQSRVSILNGDSVQQSDVYASLEPYHCV